MTHIFISYMREDQELVDRLATQLQRAGLAVWLDRDQIKPGQRWQYAIRKAIEEGAFFIACFSDAYKERSRSYAYEELTLAIEELRRRPVDRTWFIPVLLSKDSVPDRHIGAGETLHNIQWVDLYTDWDKGIQQLLEVLGPTRGAPDLDLDLDLDQILADLPLPQRVDLRRLAVYISNGRCTPIVGGLSCPDATEAINEAIRDCARESGYVSREDEDVSQIAERMEAPAGFIKDRIAQRLKDLRVAPGETYRLLAACACPIYLTTGYDDLLFQALVAQGKGPVRELCPWYQDDYRSAHSRRGEPTAQQPLIFHLFGNMAVPESLVLTESDYRQLLSSLARDPDLLPPWLAASLVSTMVLLLGFHSRDHQLRELLHCLAPLLRRNFSGGTILQLSGHAELESLATRVPREELGAAATRHFQDITSYYQARRLEIFWGSGVDLLAQVEKETQLNGGLP